MSGSPTSKLLSLDQYDFRAVRPTSGPVIADATATME